MDATSRALEESPASHVAVRFLEALHDGRIIDALDAFAADAVVTETPGRVRRGLRAIAVSLLPYRIPGRVEILSIRASPHGASARLRTTAGIGGTPRDYRASFRVSGNRIRSLRLVRD